jgi:hypothetical protein
MLLLEQQLSQSDAWLRRRQRLEALILRLDKIICVVRNKKFIVGFYLKIVLSF